MKIIEFIKLYAHLTESEGLGRMTALRCIVRLRKMSPDILSDLKDYLSNGIIPERSIEGVTFTELTNKDGFTPSRAFLFMDWLKREPEEALQYMAKERFRMPWGVKVQQNDNTQEVLVIDEPLSEEEKATLAAIRKKRGFKEDAREEDADTCSSEDIIIPE